MELDHLFIMASIDAPEAACLRRLGLPEGPPNRHPGQGTACRRFVLRHAYLELLWVCDPGEAQSEPARGTQLWDRWVDRDGPASPFGVVLRPTGDEDHPPFDCWEYRPRYLPAPLGIHVARDVPLNEPAFFYLPFQRNPARFAQEPAASAPAITRVTVGSPVPVQSTAARMVGTAGWFTTQPTDGRHVMTLYLDGGLRGVVADLRPDLPLILQW